MSAYPGFKISPTKLVVQGARNTDQPTATPDTDTACSIPCHYYMCAITMYTGAHCEQKQSLCIDSHIDTGRLLVRSQI